MPTFLSKDGTPIACSQHGAGPPLILVHGTTADSTRWTPILPRFAERFTVYACDRRGRGGSGDAPSYAMEREAEDLAAVVDGIGGPVDLVAHSYGALCSLEAAPHCRNLRRLVLYEPAIPAGITIAPSSLIDDLQGLLDAGDRDGVVETFMREVPRVPAEGLKHLKSLPAWQARVAAAHTIPREMRAYEKYSFMPERFSELKVPVLLLLGGDSPPFFRAGLKRLLSVLPNARLVELEGQQHVAMDTAPELFLKEVVAFLAG